MEDINKNDKELNQKLEDINQKMKEVLENSTKEISRKIDIAKQEIKKRIKEKQNFIKQLKEYREIPKISMIDNSEEVLNNIINPILFCLANLEVITEFTLENTNEKRELLKKLIEGNHFVPKFIELMQNMRNNNAINPNYNNVHQYLKNKVNNYMSQSPDSIINSILGLLEKEINLANNTLQNKYPNIIENNFLGTLKTKKNCNKCGIVVEIVEEKKLVIELFLRKPQKAADKKLNSIFLNLLSGRKKNNEKCKYCGEIMFNTFSLSDLKNYLILHLDRKNDPQNLMKLKLSNPLKISAEKNNKECNYQYELISILADINVASFNLNDGQILNINEINKENLKIFFKNFINDKWYKTIKGKTNEFNENNQEIYDCRPNILIYKRI